MSIMWEIMVEYSLSTIAHPLSWSIRGDIILLTSIIWYSLQYDDINSTVTGDHHAIYFNSPLTLNYSSECPHLGCFNHTIFIIVSTGIFRCQFLEILKQTLYSIPSRLFLCCHP